MVLPDPPPFSSSSATARAATPGTGAAPRFPWPALSVLLALCIVHLALNLEINRGHLTYTLDDAYIHLSLAENLARGHFGINPQTSAAPSSTILWPLLLVPTAALRVATWIPFLLNVAFAVLGLLAAWRLIRIVFPDETNHSAAVVSTILFIPFTNMVGLVFTGMEHSLQQWLAIVIVLGLVTESRSGRVPWWLVAAVVAGPLVRYEMLAMSLPAAAFLAHRGHRRTALLTAAGTLLPVALFSLVLHRLGLGLLPSSLSAKSSLDGDAAGLFGLYEGLRTNLSTGSRGVVLGIALVTMMAPVLQRDREGTERALGAYGLAMLVLHLTCGRVGWYGRYEIYAWSAATLLLLYLHRRWLRAWILGVGGRRAAIAGVALVLTAGWPYLDILTESHIAASNVHEQHYQMNRFVVEQHRAPVLANDIGYLSFRNEHEVVDIWGLTSSETRHRRESARDSAWLDEIATAHGAELAIVYEDWFPDVPRTWEPVARLHLGHRRVSIAGSSVTFFGLTPGATRRLGVQLREFASTLPAGVRLEMLRAAPGGDQPAASASHQSSTP